jgi:hypothetical protein
MYKHPKAPLAWNVFCDGDGEVIGWFAVEGNTVRINDPSGGTKLAKIESGDGLFALVEGVLTASLP